MLKYSFTVRNFCAGWHSDTVLTALVLVQVSSRFFGFLPPLKHKPAGGQLTITCSVCMLTLDTSVVYFYLAFRLHLTLTRINFEFKRIENLRNTQTFELSAHLFIPIM